MNAHYGKVVRVYSAGVELELFIVEYPIEGMPGVVRCWDRTGTSYRFRADKVKGTGERLSEEEIQQIAASNYCRSSRTG